MDSDSESENTEFFEEEKNENDDVGIFWLNLYLLYMEVMVYIKQF